MLEQKQDDRRVFQSLSEAERDMNTGFCIAESYVDDDLQKWIQKKRKVNDEHIVAVLRYSYKTYLLWKKIFIGT